MPLFADSIGLRQPRGDFCINVIDVLEAKGVQMVSRRKRFNAPKARMLEATRDADVAVHPIPSNERRQNSRLERNACLFLQHVTGPWLAEGRNLSKCRTFAASPERSKGGTTTARVRLIRFAHCRTLRRATAVDRRSVARCLLRFTAIFSSRGALDHHNAIEARSCPSPCGT